MTVYFEYKIDSTGATLQLREKSWIGRATTISVDDWAAKAANQAFTGVSRVLALLENGVGDAQRQGDSILLRHGAVASLTEPQALGLGLPPAVKASLHVETKGLINEPSFRILHKWVGLANRTLRATRNGAFLELDGQAYRLPEPLFSLVEAIQSFSTAASSGDDAQMAQLAQLQSLIPEQAQTQLSIDKYFSSFRIFHATAFSLNLQTDGRGFDFDPVLFGRSTSEKADGAVVSEAEALLTQHRQQIFALERFRKSPNVKSSYVVESGVYVYLDESLQKAMRVVHEMQRADAETKKRFAQAPQLYLKEALAADLDEVAIESLFIETEQYSARVIDIGVWVAPVLPWIKRDPSDWLPEKFGLRIGSEYVSLGQEDLEPLRNKIREAIASGEPFVEFGPEKTQIPATNEAENSIGELLGLVHPDTSKQEPPKSAEPQPSARGTPERKVLLVEENFEKLDYRKVVKPRSDVERNVPPSIRSTLKKHQLGGLEWMQTAWRAGYPGVLLADDMGLGKTLQALSFLAWLCDLKSARRPSATASGPILIVAPTGLLANWLAEHDLHTHEPGLGEICRAYGKHLSSLKTTSTRDLDTGAPSLDGSRLREADLVLTTYETLRDYHLSFATIPFSCVVFDEMQKVKSPSSLLTRSAKTVNADFVLGLTGTPIENHLTDLWCIMDIISPGELSDLKAFNQRYRPDDHDALEELHSRLLKESSIGPASMLRRMKACSSGISPAGGQMG